MKIFLNILDTLEFCVIINLATKKGGPDESIYLSTEPNHRLLIRSKSMTLSIISQNDTLVVDSRLIAEELGIEHRALIQTIKKHQGTIESAFGTITFEVYGLRMPDGRINPNPGIFAYLKEDQIKFLLSRCRNGLTPESIKKFAEMGFDFSEFPAVKRNRAKKKEVEYSNDLAIQTTGKREIKTLAGYIDILTPTEIIEVKDISMWKAALGQVLVYGHYYPSHQKRIHLYGETQESFLAMIRSHCDKFNVIVTWES